MTDFPRKIARSLLSPSSIFKADINYLLRDVKSTKEKYNRWTGEETTLEEMTIFLYKKGRSSKYVHNRRINY